MLTKRLFLIMLGLVFTLISLDSVKAQDAYYQDKTGPIALFYSSEKISLKLISGGADVASFAASNPAFDQNNPPQPTIYGFYLYYLVPGVNVSSLVDELDTNAQVEIANPVYWQQDSTDIIPCDRVSVKFKSNLTRSVVDSLNLVNQVSIIDSVWADSNWLVVKVTKQTGKSVLEMANIYEQSNFTDYAVPVFSVEKNYHSPLPPDPWFNFQWNYHNTGQVLAGGTQGVIDVDIDAPEVWEFGLGDPSIAVAVIDAGVEGHEDMSASKLLAGYDYVGANWEYPIPDNDPSPGHIFGPCLIGHGMAVAGLIAADQNDRGVSGIAPNVKIMPLKNADDAANGGPPIADAQCLVHAAFHLTNQKYPIASNSWGYETVIDTTPASVMRVKDIKFAIQFVSKFMLMIFSAGNNGYYVEFPSNMKEVIAVGATDRFDWRLGYSPQTKVAHADSLDLVAPSGCGANKAGDIWSLDMMGYYGLNYCRTFDTPADQDYVTRFAGTSASCPEVAGVAALLMSYAKKGFRANLTLNDYKEVLKHSSQDQVGPTQPLCDGWVTCSFNGGCIPPQFIDDLGWDPKYGYGRLNALQALVAIARGDVTKDGKVTLPDVVYLINYIFKGGPAPSPHKGLGDANCNGQVNFTDIVYMTNYIFKAGPAPLICFKYYY